MGSLESIRQEIDAVDEQIISLLRRRMELAKAVGVLKGPQPIFTPERERQILEKLKVSDSPELPYARLSAIFREIISAARAAEKPLSVAYWGPEGTFSHEAAGQSFGTSADCHPKSSIQEVFQSVEKRQVDYGIVPIENSIAGTIPETLDMFPQCKVRIVSETFLTINHYLGSLTTLDQVITVFAGPQPAAQCRQWLAENLPHAEIVEVTPTSQAAIHATQTPNSAAIAPRAALERYQLNPIAEHIQDHPNNRTRFVVLGFNHPAPSGHDKTSLMFKLKNKQGELHRFLGCLIQANVNLTMIESRPDLRNSFEYRFYADLAGHHSEPHVGAALQAVEEIALELSILGSYPSEDPGLKES